MAGPSYTGSAWLQLDVSACRMTIKLQFIKNHPSLLSDKMMSITQTTGLTAW